jgi:hypothetical protein
MSLKDKVMSEGMKLASHPAVGPLLQDERVLKLFMTALSVPGKVSDLTEEQRMNFVKVMGLATEREVADLKRTVRSLEDDVSRLRREIEAVRNE